MKLKDNTVQTRGVRPELIIAMIIADQVYTKHGRSFVITSITDGVHSETSLHYAGCAFDCRIYDDMDNDVLVKEIKSKLNIDYDVIFEGNHIHVEWQPRRR